MNFEKLQFALPVTLTINLSIGMCYEPVGQQHKDQITTDDKLLKLNLTIFIT